MPEALRLKRIEYMKAHPLRHWLGKKRVDYKLSEEGRDSIIEGLKKRKVSEKVITHISNLNKGKIGKKHPKWTENKKRPFHSSVRQLHQYKNWRTKIFQRDNFTCQHCLKRGGDIEADHYPELYSEILKRNNIKTVDQAIACQELWQATGRTLCMKCHRKTYRR